MLAILAVVVSVPTLTLYAAPLITLLTGLITKLRAPDWVKVGTTLFLAAAATIVGDAINAGGLDLNTRLFGSFLMTVAISIATYYGVWKPAGVAGKVQNAAPDTGLGKVE